MVYKEALDRVWERMEAACSRSGRSIDEIQLVAVCKTFPAETVKEVFDSGQRIFGESRAQDLRDKHKVLPADVCWHFIGHLQTNKIKYVAPVAELIHSIDSLHLAEALSRFNQKHDLQSKVLMEVNTSGEESKYGVDPQKAVDTYLAISELKNISTAGLMTIAPFTDDMTVVRNAFRQLTGIKDDVSRHVDSGNPMVLSMGMSADFEVAIEEGSTMVRIGSAIFGARRR